MSVTVAVMSDDPEEGSAVMARIATALGADVHPRPLEMTGRHRWMTRAILPDAAEPTDA